VNLLGTFLFAGILFSMVTIIPLSDKLGRRPLLITNCILGLVAQGGFLLYSNLYYYYLLMFLMGVSAALNPCVGYVYIMEIVPKQYEATIITLT
jgi:MFS family permease